MKRQNGSIYLIGLSVALALCLVSGTAVADDIAWDMIGSTSQNLMSYGTDAPVFSSPGDGFQKFTVGVSPSIPYALVDDTNAGYPPDTVGVVDAATDFNEFFGVVDTVNDENPPPPPIDPIPYHATWVFDISAADENLGLRMDLTAMGERELEDIFDWTYQVDGGPLTSIFSATVGEGITITYTMADGTTRDWASPLIVDGVTLMNYFQTFSTSISAGSQLTVTLTALTNGGSEAYGVRNIMVIDNAQPLAAWEPIPALSGTGIAAMVLLLIVAGAFLIRRMH